MARPLDIVARWIAYKSERGCLKETLRRYRWAVRRATSSLRRAGRTTDPRRWSVEDARWLRRRLHDDPWQLSILADLARFSRNFVFNEVGLPKKGPPQRVRWLSEEATTALVEVTKKDRLLRLVVLLGLGQGLRRIEWLRLQVGDIDFAGNRLLVRGKGQGQPKRVWMPLHPALPPALQDYLVWRGRKVERFLRVFPLTPIPEELLVHRRGERLIPYGVGGADRWMLILERRLRARGISVKLSTHMLRRTAATLLERTLLRSPQASRDGVYRMVQGFLRHESIATTMRYLEPDPSRQAAAMEAFAQALPWNAGETPNTGPPSRAEPPARRSGGDRPTTL
ncbi:MAG TPA: site-specific integrase [Thermoplasmata archaeon]|nr:site-specific integrase [Thermoplasmata archaeon]